MRRTKNARTREPAEVAEAPEPIPLNQVPITVGNLPDVIRATSSLAAVEARTALDAARAALNVFTLAVRERRERDVAQDRINRRLHAMLQLSLPREYGFHYMAKAALEELAREECDNPLSLDGGRLPDFDAQIRHLIDETTRR